MTDSQVQGISRDHLCLSAGAGGQVLSYTEYDFAGKALRDKTMRQPAGGGSWLRLRQRYAYDAMGRVTKVWQRVGTDPELLLSQSRYNALGQLVEKNLHSTNGTSFLQSVDYRHHIRGWLTKVNELVPSAATAITQRNAYVQQVSATIVAADDQYGRPGLALALELRHADLNANPDLPAPPTLSWELPILVGDPTSQGYKEYEALLGQEFTVDFDAPEGPQPDLKTLALAPLLDAWSRAGLQDPAGVLDKVISTAALEQSHWQATEANDLFALRLDYEAGNGKLKADPRHNGNISAVSWRSAGDGVVRGYGYNYDAIGRLREAHYAAHSAGSTKWDAEVGRYDVPLISYDQNGNLTQMTQHGWRPSTASFGMIDDLRYTYNGNQLQAVRDQSTQHGDKDFQDNGATSFQDYTYDAQGSLTADANLGVTAVTYNHLGLTETVTLTGSRQLRYLYAADGTRLARVRVQPGQADLRDDLVGAFAYQGGVLNHILNGEGRIVPAVSPGRAYRHEYHYRDQLGNLRLAFSDLNNNGMAEVGDILQEAHYYPYGLGFSGMATVSNGMASRYTFNGKEAQEAFGMGWMDFGARMYDSQVGRWMAVDRLGEVMVGYSPYGYVLGNPIKWVDFNGLFPILGGDPKKRISVPSDAVIKIEPAANVEYIVEEVNNALLRATEGYYSLSDIYYVGTIGLENESGKDAMYRYINTSLSNHDMRRRDFNGILNDLGYDTVFDDDLRLKISFGIESWELVDISDGSSQYSTGSSTSVGFENGSKSSIGLEKGGATSSFESNQSNSILSTRSHSSGTTLTDKIRTYMAIFFIKIEGVVDWAGPFDTFYGDAPINMTIAIGNQSVKGTIQTSIDLDKMEQPGSTRIESDYSRPATRKTWEGSKW